MNKELIEKIITYNYNEYGAEFGDALVDLKHENEWLHHIIKEVRKYIKDTEQDGYKLVWLHLDNSWFEAGIKDILDKENEYE